MGDHRPRVGQSPHAVVIPPVRSLSRSSYAGSTVSRQEEGRHGEPSQQGHHSATYHARADSRESHSMRHLSDLDRTLQSSKHLAPLPISSFPPADDRQFAFSDRYPHNTGTLSDTSGRHPSVPPPQRPASSHTVQQLSRSQPPPSPPASRGAQSVHDSHPAPPNRVRYSPAIYHSPQPLSPPASRGQTYPAPPRPPFHAALAAANGPVRSRSRTSIQSDYCPDDVRRPSTTPSDQGDDASSPEDEGNASSERAPGHGGLPLQRPKRTRVLMTHVQQQRLGTLWKRVGSTSSASPRKC